LCSFLFARVQICLISLSSLWSSALLMFVVMVLFFRCR
jgi:hypothetical protein